MSAEQRVTNDQVVAAYREHGNVWKAAKSLGICGQSLWERLKRLGHPMAGAKWSADEVEELKRLVNECPLGEVARRLGRPYAGVALKVSRLGLGTRFGNRQKRKVPRGAGLDKVSVSKFMEALAAFDGSLRQFCRMNGFDIDTFVLAAQARAPEAWAAYTATHSDLGEADCPYCGAKFFPLSKKQRNCTRKCASAERVDRSYFGGRRRNTIGLADGVCQLCERKDAKGLSSHHVLGKENDPDNEVLIALCPGCHQIVGSLAGRAFVDTSKGWENLIHLVLARRFAEQKAPFAATYACVEIERVESIEDEDTGASGRADAAGQPGVHVEVEEAGL